MSWLENDVFLVAHTPSSVDPGSNPRTTFHIITRQQQKEFVFQRLPEVCPPYGLNRSPPYHFLQRLKNFPPNLQDMIVVACTASTDIGMFTRSKAALTHDVPSEKIVNVFTTTSMADDSRRAQLPMTEDMSDTSPIGVSFDLSSKEQVPRPLPSEEMELSPTPLPALMILNNEGLLACWWVVYTDSLRQGTVYPSLTVAEDIQKQTAPQGARQASPFATGSQPAAPTFGQGTFGVSSATPAFGGTSTIAPAFESAFGAAPTFGKQSSPWGGTANSSSPQTGGATFGQTSFGTPSSLGQIQGAAFGATRGLGAKSSPWGGQAPGTSTATGAVFGQSGGLGTRTGTAFGVTSTPNSFGPTPASDAPALSSGGGFASFANGPSMASAALGAGGSSFASAMSGTPSGISTNAGTSFGMPSAPSGKPSVGIFGSGSGGFTLGSTFKGDGTAKDDLPKPTDDARSSMFGNGFGNALGDMQQGALSPVTKEADMDEDNSLSEGDLSSPSSAISQGSMTPKRPSETSAKTFSMATPKKTGGFFGTEVQNRVTPAAVQSSTPITEVFGKPTPIDTATPATGGLFGTKSQSPTTLAAVQNSTPSWSFPQDTPESTTPKETPEKAKQNDKDTTESPTIKQEPVDDTHSGFQGVSSIIPEAPLPPDLTTEANHAAEKMSPFSNHSEAPADDAPLPPDFVKISEPKPSARGTSPEKQPELPIEHEDDGLDDEGSGVDVAQELTPPSAPSQNAKITPISSFGASTFGGSSFDRSPVEGLFSNSPRQQPDKPPRPLFGELGGKSAPIFPPPSKTQESPRSPSPVRSVRLGDVLRPDNARSLSAPGPVPKALVNRRNLLSQTGSNLRPQDPIQQAKQDKEHLAAREAERRAEEEQDLSDREDEKVRQELATDVEPTRTLEPFLAHQDYIGNIDKPGIPGQIEKVYRDINSMIDTLGLNARSLKAFTKGHSEQYKDGGRTREDLETQDDWCLIELEDLSAVENQLGEELRSGRISDVQEKLNSCRELQKDLAKLRSRHNDIKRGVEAKSDPEQIEAIRSTPLSVEQASLQHDLRRDFANFQRLLADAEEGITMLRAKLASHEHSKNRSGPHKAPTVEAVTNTIIKMTSMVEKRSGDIDVLETQMRKLRFSSVNGTSSIEASPSHTPPSSSRKGKSMFGRSRNMGSSFADSVNSPLKGSSSSNSTPKKGMSDVTSEDVKRYRAKVERRKEVTRALKETLVRVGPRVRRLDNL